MKSACASCGKLIEYEAPSAGMDIACPHCGKVTKLATYSAPPPVPHSAFVQPKPKKNTTLIVVLVIGIGLAVAVPVLGLLAAIAIPNFIKARQASQTAACIANLKMIDAAKASWASTDRKSETDLPSEEELFGVGRYITERPTCPGNGEYSINAIDESPTCTIPAHVFAAPRRKSNLTEAQRASQRARCVANLRTIDGAKAVWALENKKTPADVPEDHDLFGSSLYIRTKPHCPGNGRYSLNAVSEKPTCTVAQHAF
jgi:competence protein ComGC/phage FluMu protein Com